MQLAGRSGAAGEFKDLCTSLHLSVRAAVGVSGPAHRALDARKPDLPSQGEPPQSQAPLILYFLAAILPLSCCCAAYLPVDWCLVTRNALITSI